MAAVATLILAAAACSSPPIAVALGITEQDDGTTFTIPRGAKIQLSLPATHDWTLDTDAAALRLISRSSHEGRLRWLFEAVKAGVVELRASGAAKCASEAPPCDDPKRGLRIVIEVR